MPFSASKNQTAELVANYATYIKVFAQYLARPNIIQVTYNRSF